MKACTKCKISKSLNEFHNCKSKKSGKMSHCKDCRNKHNRDRANHIGHDVLYQRALNRNPERYKKRAKEYYENNKKEVIARVEKWRNENPDCRKIEYQKTREKKIAYAREWALQNKDKRRKTARDYADRFNSNPKNRPYIVCRKLLTRVVRLTNSRKKGRTELALGYTRYEFKSHIDSLFLDGMSWDNHGEWHIDHIKPVSAFIKEGETDPKVINALDNLQPLWAKDNLSKGAKYDA